MKALVLLGCPETPSQTPMAVYVFNKLTKLGYDVTIVANPAASKLVKISDPEGLYNLKLTKEIMIYWLVLFTRMQPHHFS